MKGKEYHYLSVLSVKKGRAPCLVFTIKISQLVSLIVPKLKEEYYDYFKTAKDDFCDYHHILDLRTVKQVDLAGERLLNYIQEVHTLYSYLSFTIRTNDETLLSENYLSPLKILEKTSVFEKRDDNDNEDNFWKYIETADLKLRNK